MIEFNVPGGQCDSKGNENNLGRLPFLLLLVRVKLEVLPSGPCHYCANDTVLACASSAVSLCAGCTTHPLFQDWAVFSLASADR